MTADNQSIKESFLERVYGHMDDRLIEFFLPEYIETMDDMDSWSEFENVLDVVEDFKRFVGFAEDCMN